MYYAGALTFFFPPFLTPTCSLFFFFNDTATTEIYTLSLHDALPICRLLWECSTPLGRPVVPDVYMMILDRKSTRLNSSHGYISYAVFCLKKKKKNKTLEPAAITVCAHEVAYRC